MLKSPRQSINRMLGRSSKIKGPAQRNEDSAVPAAEKPVVVADDREAHIAATKLQSRVRGSRTRKVVQQSEAVLNHAPREAAARTLQTLYHSKRRVVTAATTAAASASSAAASVKALVEVDSGGERAAVVIQSLYRGRQARTLAGFGHSLSHSLTQGLEALLHLDFGNIMHRICESCQTRVRCLNAISRTISPFVRSEPHFARRRPALTRDTRDTS